MGKTLRNTEDSENRNLDREIRKRQAKRREQRGLKAYTEERAETQEQYITLPRPF